jgi:TatD DNase family protein
MLVRFDTSYRSLYDCYDRKLIIHRVPPERIMIIPTLDAHAHIDSTLPPDSLQDCGFVLAMTLSLDEADRAASHDHGNILRGPGCHPRFLRCQESFDAKHFRCLAERTAIIGEVGLDTGSRVPLEMQLKTFRQVLAIVADLPRFVSIHSYQATGLVLQELEHIPISIPVLHWWTGNVAETKKAVQLGCYFSIHSAVARHSKFRLHVPQERVLVESDHGYKDPPAAIPCRVNWVEFLAAQQYNIEVDNMRKLAWTNLARIIHETNSIQLVPTEFENHFTKIKNPA